MSHARGCKHEYDDGHWEGTKYVKKCMLCGIRSEAPPLREVRTPPVEVELPPEMEPDEAPGEQQ